MYEFTCSNNHASYSSSKKQKDPSCPKCGESVLIVEDSLDSPTPEGES